MSRRQHNLEALSFQIVMTVIAILALILIVSPSLVVVIVSFTSGFSLKFPPPGYSTRWYLELWNAWQLQFAARNSVVVALWSTGLSIVLGVAASLAISRSKRLTAKLLDSLFMSPLVLPALAFGLAALMFFSLIGLPVSLLTLVIGHTIVCVPYVVRNTVAALAQLEPTLLESSAILGASRLYTFRRIVLPLIRPGIISGAFIAFMSSFDNVPVSLFLRDAATDMLPIRMWQDLEGKLDVTIAALSSVLIIATIALMAIMERTTGLSKRLTG
ncbi:putative ABC transporter permease protein [Bradyrhizobium oligotrophicum S58]|uniref:Putative ABC transporter permease protein n=1 Tax=Bradyrhizobium oligotrophicum S58 TaxID=1245469 RepID=M4ZG51_9BRAD|nr:ABC transporter permease [Bradyrhizobium oligotrophicum]BAM92729.1 putative ABC transporter permease protein [Bradyrhizobium oligotrophicum S58]